MDHPQHRAVIERYVEAYNAFDVAGMVELLHQDIVFRNFAGSELTTETEGLEAFRELAEQSVKLFSNRHQAIAEFHNEGDRVEVQIDYEGVLAADLPNGLKAGDTIQLKGKSIFAMTDGQISLIEDYS